MRIVIVWTLTSSRWRVFRYAMDTSTSLAGKMLLSYPYIDESGARQNAIRAPTPEALLACARASFDPNALTIDVSQAAFQDPTCYPVSRQPAHITTLHTLDTSSAGSSSQPPST